MAWTQLVSEDTGGLAWVQWVDEPKARGWLAELSRLLALGEPTAVEGPERVLAVARALGAFYAAIDLPPYADPMYRDAWIAADRGSPFHGAADWLEAATEVLTHFSPRYREAVSDDRLIYLDLVRRVELSRDGRVTGDAATLNGPPIPGKDPDGSATSCGGGPTPWDCWVWSWWLPGWLSADRDARFSARVPLFLHWRLFSEVARSVVRAGVRGVVQRARRWVVAKNLRTARDLGLSGADALLRASLSGDLDRLAVSEDFATVESLGGALAGIFVAAGAGPFGALFALGAGIPAALQEAFGTAVGRTTDVFGRQEPVYELGSISGTQSPRRAPTQEVPDPPRAVGPSIPGYTPTLWLPAGPTVLANRRGGGGLAVVGVALVAGVLLLGGRRGR